MAAKNFTLTLDELQTKFIYKDGNLIHRVSKGRFPAGSIAGSISRDGYRRTAIKNKTYLVHRIIFFMHYGYMPEVVDHIDGNGLNNNLSNLRPATQQQNCQNRRLSIANKSGYKGVFWQKSVKKWRVDCDRKYLGLFDTLDEAIKCAQNYRQNNHKGFVNDGIYCTN